MYSKYFNKMLTLGVKDLDWVFCIPQMHPVYWAMIGTVSFVVVFSVSISMYFGWMVNQKLEGSGSDCRNLGELEQLWVSVLTM